jgi:nitrogen fixation NifU-like protein
MPDRNLYKQKIIDHYKNPRNYGEMGDADMEAHVTNSVCGDEVTVYLKVKGGVVKEVMYKGSGCAISVAGMSMLSKNLVGKKVEDLEEIEDKVALELLGLDEKTSRKKCATLGLRAIEKAVKMEEDDPCDFC